MQRTFTVKALWDEEAGIYYSQSDIDGLHIETETIEEFENVIKDTAIELIVANHIPESELATRPVKDLVPAILWQRPDREKAAQAV